MKSFNYQIAITVLLCKHKITGDIEYALVCFNSATKTIINSDKYDLNKFFQEILCRIDNWINEGSGWIIKPVEAQYVNISIYSTLIGRIESPDKLKNPIKGLINLKKMTINVFFGVISGI